MKRIFLAAIFCVVPMAVWAQDDFNLSGELRLKYFALNNEPDIFRDDYTNYRDESADAEVRLLVGSKLPYGFDMDLHPYLQYSEENKIARLGLKADLHYEICDDWLKIGSTHHSWHNADIESPHSRGRSQDSVFAELYFARLDQIKFYLEPRYYLHNAEPLEIKTIYTRDEPGASGELALRVLGNYDRFSSTIRPYVQTSWDTNRYGIYGEVTYTISDFLSIFVDGEYYTVNGEHRETLAIGLAIKFK